MLTEALYPFFFNGVKILLNSIRSIWKDIMNLSISRMMITALFLRVVKKNISELSPEKALFHRWFLGVGAKIQSGHNKFRFPKNGSHF